MAELTTRKRPAKRTPSSAEKRFVRSVSPVVPAIFRHQRAELVEITPRKAEKWFDNQPRNRRVVKSQVDRIARSILAGGYEVNGETMKFNRAGQMLDGQHTCLAVIATGVSVWRWAIFGVDDDARKVMDRNKRRDFKDDLDIGGESSTQALASATRMMFYFDRNGRMGVRGNGVDTLELEPVLERHPRLRESVGVGRALNSADVRYPHSIGVALHYVLARVDREAADAFFDQVVTGHSLEPGSPILALRAAVIRSRDDSHRKQADYLLLSALTIKAWNAWRAGDAMKSCVWRVNGGKQQPERFPRISGYPYGEGQAPGEEE
jgi:hypothetical protein